MSTNKRLLDAIDGVEDDIKPNDKESTPPPAEKRPKTKAPKTPTPTKATTTLASPGGLSTKAKCAHMIFEAGLKAVNKAEVEAETGLNPKQQHEMTRKDKGGLRRAFNGFIESL